MINTNKKRSKVLSMLIVFIMVISMMTPMSAFAVAGVAGTPNAPMTESNLDSASIVLELTEDTFADGTLDEANFTLTNAPAGTTISAVSYTDTTGASIDLDFDGTDFDADVTDFSVTIAGAELTGGNPLTTSNMTITANVEAITWSATTFAEAGANNGTIATVVTLALADDTFTVPGGAMTATTHYNVANVPAGLTVVVTGTSTTSATIALSGTAISHAAIDDVSDMEITFLNAAFTGGSAAAVTNYTKTNLAVAYDDPAPTPVITWSGTTFAEAGANDGTIATVVTLALANDTFTVPGGAMTATTHYNVANVPAGLTVVVTGTSTTSATIALSGTAISHAALDGIADMEITFLNAAFTGGSAAAVTNYTKTNLAVTYDDPAVTPVITWSATTFTEAPANDGTIATVVTLALVNDTFVVTSAAMTATTHYNVANVPAGLTVVVTGTSTTSATIELTGTAAAHAAANNVSNLTITFLDAAFTGADASAVTNYTKTNLAVAYSDPASYPITIGSVSGGTATVTTSAVSAISGTTITVTISGMQVGKYFGAVTMTALTTGALAKTEIATGAAYTYTFDMIDEPVTITVDLNDIPGHVGNVTTTNAILVGDYLFKLDPANAQYSLNNYIKAAQTAYDSGVDEYHVYLHVGSGVWFDLVTDPTLATPIANLNTINGDGLFKYSDMTIMPGVTP